MSNCCWARMSLVGENFTQMSRKVTQFENLPKVTTCQLHSQFASMCWRWEILKYLQINLPYQMTKELIFEISNVQFTVWNDSWADVWEYIYLFVCFFYKKSWRLRADVWDIFFQNLAEIRCATAEQRADDAEEECHRLKAVEESCG